MLLQIPEYLQNIENLVSMVQLFHHRGWSPATSTNYSFRNPVPHHHTYTISVSGVDKSQFSKHHLMLIDQQGEPLEDYKHFKPSAETLIHTYLYKDMDNKAVLHTHSVFATVLSKVLASQKGIWLQNYEVLKGIRGIVTHETEIFIPIFENSQDMVKLAQDLDLHYQENSHCFAFLLAGHGLYVWGNNLTEAKRHLESIEYLLECYYLELQISHRHAPLVS